MSIFPATPSAARLVLGLGAVAWLCACGPADETAGPAKPPIESKSGTSADDEVEGAEAPQVPIEGDETALSVEIGAITLSATADANGGRPTRIDLVLVYGEAFVPRIRAMSSADWFAQRSSIEGEAAGEVGVVSWSLQAGSTIPETAVDVEPGALAAFVFGDVPANEAAQVEIEGSGTLSIVVSADGLSAELLQ